VVEGAQDSTQRKRFKTSWAPTLIVLQQHQHVESGAPSTTVRSLRELQWSPSPAIAGAERKAIAFSRRASHPSLAARTKATDVSPPNKKGGGAPEGANRMGRTTRTDVATCPRHGRGARHERSAYTNRPLRARSPFGAPPRLWSGFHPPDSAPGQASWDAGPAGVTRPRLSQSSGSTPRTGHSTGGHDAQNRPGAVCETARGYRTRSTFRIASRKRPC
jgi:hypothetical protein